MSETDGMRLTRAMRKALQPAVIYGWVLEVSRTGRVLWGGDTTSLFTAHGALGKLVYAGLMERVRSPYGETFRKTELSKTYVCAAPGCHMGGIYGESPDGFDEQIGKCPACEGTGLTLEPRKI